MKSRTTTTILGIGLAATSILAGCNRPVTSDPGPPPDKRLAGPAEFTVLPDGHLVVDRPQANK
jgi:hypothetical protein